MFKTFATTRKGNKVPVSGCFGRFLQQVILPAKLRDKPVKSTTSGSTGRNLSVSLYSESTVADAYLSQSLGHATLLDASNGTVVFTKSPHIYRSSDFVSVSPTKAFGVGITHNLNKEDVPTMTKTNTVLVERGHAGQAANEPKRQLSIEVKLTTADRHQASVSSTSRFHTTFAECREIGTNSRQNSVRNPEANIRMNLDCYLRESAHLYQHKNNWWMRREIAESTTANIGKTDENNSLSDSGFSDSDQFSPNSTSAMKEATREKIPPSVSSSFRSSVSHDSWISADSGFLDGKPAIRRKNEQTNFEEICKQAEKALHLSYALEKNGDSNAANISCQTAIDLLQKAMELSSDHSRYVHAQTRYGACVMRSRSILRKSSTSLRRNSSSALLDPVEPETMLGNTNRPTPKNRSRQKTAERPLSVLVDRYLPMTQVQTLGRHKKETKRGYASQMKFDRDAEIYTAYWSNQKVREQATNGDHRLTKGKQVHWKNLTDSPTVSTRCETLRPQHLPKESSPPGVMRRSSSQIRQTGTCPNRHSIATGYFTTAVC